MAEIRERAQTRGVDLQVSSTIRFQAIVKQWTVNLMTTCVGACLSRSATAALRANARRQHQWRWQRTLERRKKQSEVEFEVKLVFDLYEKLGPEKAKENIDLLGVEPAWEHFLGDQKASHAEI